MEMGEEIEEACAGALCQSEAATPVTHGKENI